MKKVQAKIDVKRASSLQMGRIDKHHLDATSQHDIVGQQKGDGVDALLGTAKFARRVREHLVLGATQFEFSHRIDVPLETITVLNKTPESALLA